jgi:hypothetical protein
VKSSSVLPLSLAAAGVLLLGLLTLVPRPAIAAPAALPTRPPTATPPDPTATPDPSLPTGGLIELRIQTPPANAWTVVQWEDGLGGWHTVEGWQGTLDDGISKLWWVAPKDLDTGPFRWVIFDKRDGKVWGISPSFDLPATTGQRVVLEVPEK